MGSPLRPLALWHFDPVQSRKWFKMSQTRQPFSSSSLPSIWCDGCCYVGILIYYIPKRNPTGQAGSSKNIKERRVGAVQPSRLDASYPPPTCSAESTFIYLPTFFSPLPLISPAYLPQRGGRERERKKTSAPQFGSGRRSGVYAKLVVAARLNSCLSCARSIVSSVCRTRFWISIQGFRVVGKRAVIFKFRCSVCFALFQTPREKKKRILVTRLTERINVPCCCGFILFISRVAATLHL